MLKELYHKILRKPYIDDIEIKRLIKEIQRALIAADIDVGLVLERTRAIERRFAEEKGKSLNTSKLLAKIVYEELRDLLGKEGRLPLEPQRIMLVGLYGAGKTTTAAKLANFLKTRGMKVVLASADFDRPAGQEQLRQLSEKIGISYAYRSNTKKLLEELSRYGEEIVILDTPGRNAFEPNLLEELKEIYAKFQPTVVFFVASADTGSVIGKHIERLAEYIPINGIIITKFEGSGKAGGALSAAASHDVPIYFLGTGEKIDQLEEFSKDKVIKKILGIPSLENIAEELKKIDSTAPISDFSLTAFQQQMKEMNKISLQSLLSNMGVSLPKDVLIKGESELKKMDAMINSMTPQEREFPEIILKEPGRIKRIAKGSGTTEQDVKKLLKQFFKAKRLIKKLKKDRRMLGKIPKLFGG